MNTLKYKFSLLTVLTFFVFLLLQSCGEKTTTTNTKETISVTSPKAEKTEPTLSAVYSSFDDAAYLFNYKNDTTYVVNFWATWCSPCIAELPYFEKLNKTYKDKKVKVILVSLDSSKTIDTKLRPFIEREKLMSHVVALTDTDSNTWIDKVNPEWDGAIPVTIVYNKEDYEFIRGELENYEELEDILKSFME